MRTGLEFHPKAFELNIFPCKSLNMYIQCFAVVLKDSVVKWNCQTCAFYRAKSSYMCSHLNLKFQVDFSSVIDRSLNTSDEGGGGGEVEGALEGFYKLENT